METTKNLPAVVAFVNVGELKSFSLAAKRMKVSKSHVSKLINSLEQYFDSTLFIRTTRSVKLTEVGEHMFHLYKDHIFELERINSNFKEISKVTIASLKITTAGAIGEDIVTQAVSRVLSRHSSLNIEMLFSENILDIEKEDIDLAIRVSSEKPKDGKAIKIGERYEHVCATSNFLKRNNIPKKPSDLKKINCLVGNNSTWSFKKSRYTYNIEVSGNFKSTNARSLCRAALSSLGLVKLPNVYLKNHLDRGDFIEVLSDFTDNPIPIWAVIPHKKQETAVLKLLIDQLKQEFIN